MADVPDTIWAMASMDGKWSDGHCTNVQPQVNDITAPFIFEYTCTDISHAQEMQQAHAWIAEMAETLKWYGEQARLARLMHSEGDDGRHAISMDGGKRARAALKAKP
jgi:hypothetical protein